jgi:hypothetical protein
LDRSCEKFITEKVLQGVKEERNILHTIKRSKANWIDHILRRNCLLKHTIEGKLEGRTEMTGRRGRRRKQLLDGLKKERRYWKLKEEALDRTLWRTRFGRDYGPVVRDYRMNDYYYRHHHLRFRLRGSVLNPCLLVLLYSYIQVLVPHVYAPSVFCFYSWHSPDFKKQD